MLEWNACMGRFCLGLSLSRRVYLRMAMWDYGFIWVAVFMHYADY